MFEQHGSNCELYFSLSIKIYNYENFTIGYKKSTITAKQSINYTFLGITLVSSDVQ